MCVRARQSLSVSVRVCVSVSCARKAREKYTSYACERVYVRVCMHACVCVKERIDLGL